MKLESLKSEANLHSAPSAHDIDVIDKLGPEIHKHLNSLNALCKLIPESNDIIEKVSELKQLISSKVKLQSGVLEKNDTTKITVEDVQKMYNEYKTSIGEAAWVAIARQLKSKGVSKDLIDSTINEAILKLK